MGLCHSKTSTQLATHSPTITMFRELSSPKVNEATDKKVDTKELTDSQLSYGSNVTPHQAFSKEAIRIVYDFWTDHIQLLTNEKKTQFGVLLYSHLFCNLVRCRQTLLTHGTVESVGWGLLHHIKKLISTLHQKPEYQWEKELKAMTSKHEEWGIRYEDYQQFLQALHATFEEYFHDSNVYSLRVKYCLENIFTNAAVVITGRNFSKLFRDRVDDFMSLEFLDSLEICLSHSTGREYFDRYLEQSYCAEYVAFFRNFDEFKRLASNRDRFLKASKIYEEHFSVRAPSHISVINHEYVLQLESKLKDYIENTKTKETVENTSNNEIIMIDPSLFDTLYHDVKKGIEKDIWPNFVTAIYSIKEITRPQAI